MYACILFKMSTQPYCLIYLHGFVIITKHIYSCVISCRQIKFFFLKIKKTFFWPTVNHSFRYKKCCIPTLECIHPCFCVWQSRIAQNCTESHAMYKFIKVSMWNKKKAKKLFFIKKKHCKLLDIASILHYHWFSNEIAQNRTKSHVVSTFAWNKP